MPTPKSSPRKHPYLRIAREILEGSVPLVSAVMQLRNQPRTLDYLALGIAGINAVLKGKSVYDRFTNPTPRAFFARRDARGEFIWIECPRALGPFLHEAIEDPREMVLNQGDTRSAIFVGKIGDEIVSWEEDQTGHRRGMYSPFDMPPLYVRRGRQHHVYRQVRHRLWERLGHPHLRLTEQGELTVVDETPGDIIITPDIKHLLRRVQRFHAAAQPRAYLLEGSPGTGKSTAVKYLVNRMGLRSLRLQPTHVMSSRFDSYGEIKINPAAILEVLEPDIVILDDIDHVHESPVILELLSACRSSSKIILGTVNNKWRLDGAALRTGRFDDHIAFHALPGEAIAKVLGERYAHLLDLVHKWPISYISDLVYKAEVLGLDEALLEVLQTSQRIEQIDAVIGAEDNDNEER